MVVRRKFLYKVLTLFIVIVIVYTAITSSIIFYKSSQMLDAQNNHNHQLFIDQSSNYADFKFQTAMEFVYKISTLQSLIDYRYSEKTNYLTIAGLYKDLIEQLRGFSQLGFTLGITKLSDNLVVTGTGTFSTANYLKELGVQPEALDRFQQQQSETLASGTYVVPESLMLSSGKIVLIHQTVNSQFAPLYFFIVMDSVSVLPKTVDSPDGNLYLFTDEAIASYIHNNQLKMSEQTASALLSTTGNIYHEKIGSSVNYMHHSKVIPNLHYMYASSLTSFGTIFAAVWKTALFPSLLLLVMGFLLAYLATRSSYKPIKQLLQFLNEHNEARQGSASSGDEPLGQATTRRSNSVHELAYIQSSIEQIYSLNHALQHKLDHSVVHLQEDFFRRVIYGIASEDYIQENIAAIKLERFYTELQLALFEMEGLTTLHNTMPMPNLTASFRSIIEEHIGAENFFVLALDQNKYGIILQSIDKSRLAAIAKDIIDQLEDKLPLDITAFLSDSYPLAELTSALQEVLRLNGFQYAATEKVLDSSHVQPVEDAACYYPIDAENHIINYVNTNELGKAYELLRHIIDENEKRALSTPSGLSNLKHSLLTTCKRCLNANNKTLQSFVKEYPQAVDAFMEASGHKFSETAFSLYEQIFNFCNKDKFSLESSTASQIFIYIHQHFDKDLSLTDIANHFNLSESYISKLLKNSLDINFKQYVNTLKVKRAKELLSQKTYKVHEVAAIVGCNNTNTFIRIFKQYIGVSPGEYLKNLG